MHIFTLFVVDSAVNVMHVSTRLHVLLMFNYVGSI